MMDAPDLTRLLVAPMEWTEESPNFWIGRGQFGFLRDYRIFDGVVKIYSGAIDAWVTPVQARKFYDAEYVAFVAAALDPAALGAMLAEARAGGLQEAIAVADDWLNQFSDVELQDCSSREHATASVLDMRDIFLSLIDKEAKE